MVWFGISLYGKVWYDMSWYVGYSVAMGIGIIEVQFRTSIKKELFQIPFRSISIFLTADFFLITWHKKSP
jgi:hypothetical protein